MIKNAVDWIIHRILTAMDARRERLAKQWLANSAVYRTAKKRPSCLGRAEEEVRVAVRAREKFITELARKRG